jgi:hypothetical protein
VRGEVRRPLPGIIDPIRYGSVRSQPRPAPRSPGRSCAHFLSAAPSPRPSLGQRTCPRRPSTSTDRSPRPTLRLARCRNTCESIPERPESPAPNRKSLAISHFLIRASRFYCVPAVGSRLIAASKRRMVSSNRPNKSFARSVPPIVVGRTTTGMWVRSDNQFAARGS